MSRLRTWDLATSYVFNGHTRLGVVSRILTGWPLPSLGNRAYKASLYIRIWDGHIYSIWRVRLHSHSLPHNSFLFISEVNS